VRVVERWFEHETVDDGVLRISMERLREFPVRIVHGGYDDSFGRDRLLELIDGYVRTRA
jgi:hypothetical protein